MKHDPLSIAPRLPLEMRSSFPLWLLSATAAVLIIANWHVRQPDASSVVADAQQLDNGSPEAVSIERPPPVENISPAPVPPLPQQPAFNWVAVETSDYKQYAKNLRAIGFPEELVRAIVIADINALYAPREAPLSRKPIPHDAAFSERNTSYSPSEWDRTLKLRDVQMEKQAALKEILGIYVPRELLRGPRSRNYEAYEYALGLLPSEKRDAAQWLVENEIIADALNHEKYSGAEEVDAYRRSREERDAALKQILTPEEFARYEMNTTSAGTELARRVIGMEPTDAEFQTMFELTDKCWLESGGVYSRWRAVPVPSEQIAAAEAKLQAGLQEALGPDRYLDYQMATSEIGQQLRNLGARYELPRQTLAQAYELQREADGLAKIIAQAARVAGPDRSSSAVPPQLQVRLVDLQAQMEQILGPLAWQAWTNGRNRRVGLEP